MSGFGDPLVGSSSMMVDANDGQSRAGFPGGLDYGDADLNYIAPLPDDSDDSTYEGNGKGKEPTSGQIPQSQNEEGENEGFSSDDQTSEPTRPNKYQGPASTWRFWTRYERQEATAIEDIRARNLSIHLYNAFALKQRARDIARSVTAEQRGDQQFTTERNGITIDEPSTFVPPKGWTAWPMPVDTVPRGDEHLPSNEDDIWTLKGPQDLRPSAELEECLMAQMLKTAKERFESREWAKKPTRAHSVARSTASGPDDKAESSGKEEDDDGSVVDFPSAVRLRPVVTVDDDKARMFLRPAVRRTLSNLDDLLLGLHRARQAYVTIGSTSVSESESETEAEKTLKGKGKRAAGRGRSRSRGRKRSRNPSQADSTQNGPVEGALNEPDMPGLSAPEDMLDAELQKTGSSKPSRSRSRHERMARLGLRDWSDIVGIASMTGWPAAAVMRTSKRCSELFGQDMEFRTLDEGNVSLGKDDEGPLWKYSEDGGTETPLDTSAGPALNFLDTRKQYKAYCPVKECSRHVKGFSRMWNLNQHLKTKHPDVIVDTRRVKSAPPDTDGAG